MALREKRAILLTLGSLTVTIVAYLTYARLASVDLGELIAEFSIFSILASLALLFMSELVKSIRLYIIVKGLGTRVSLSSCIVARLVGNTAGLLTPGNLGAEPVRVLTLASLNGIRIEKLAAAGVLESLYDIMVTLAIAILASFFYMPDALPVLIVSLAIALLWIAGLTGLVYREGMWKRIVLKIAGRLPEKYREQVFSRYSEFTNAVAQGMVNKVSLASLTLTVVSIMFIAFSFFPLINPGLLSIDVRMMLTILIGYSMSFVMSFLPTPGGSGFFEYGLGVALDKNLALSWRMVFILFSIVPTVVLLGIGVHIRTTIANNIKKSITGQPIK